MFLLFFGKALLLLLYSEHNGPHLNATIALICQTYTVNTSEGWQVQVDMWDGRWMWLLKPGGFKNEVVAQQLDRDMQVLTKLAGYPYVGLLPAVRPISPHICADFASPGYFMGWNSFGGGARITFGGLQPPPKPSPGYVPAANHSHRSLLFLLPDWLHEFPGLFTDTSEHIRFYFVVFLLSTLLQILPTSAFPVLLQDWLHGFPRLYILLLLSISVFYFLVFFLFYTSLFSCRYSAVD